MTESTSAEMRIAPAPARLRLTALITNYNYGHYLPAAVEAMVNQSRPADELILIDDASTDGSQRVVDELGRRFPFIKVVKHQANRGANPSGQEALEMATGDYFYWGSADDMVLPGFFESAMSLLEIFPTAPICAGVPVHWNEEFDQQIETCRGMPREPGFLTAEELWPLVRSRAFEMSGAWAFYRIADLKAVGGFRASLKWHVDFFLVHALALGRGVCWTAQPTAVFRIQPKSYSSSRFDRKHEDREVLRELVRIVVTEMPMKIRAGFRTSGVLGRFAWPIAVILLTKRMYWSQLSLSFCRVCLATIARIAMAAIARAILPAKLRLAVRRRDRAETKFDLSGMKSQKTI